MVNTKKQPRKTRRQQQALKLTASKQKVEKANALEQILPPSFQQFKSKDGTIFKLTCNRAKDLSAEIKDWIFDLTERNMKRAYENSSWGWKAQVKKDELFDLTSWHLIATCNGENIGYSHFRFDLEDDKEVLYCYELQLESIVRRKGLGGFMMHALESLALRNEMSKVMLTVFKNNATAVQFFHILGYKLDSSSPPDFDRLHYIILSKQNLRRVDLSNC